MIIQTINDKIAEALKARDEIKLSTLRLLASALNYEKISKQHELSDEEEISVVRRESKKRIDAIEAYEKVGALDRAEKEKKELEILKEYMPPEMSEDELNQAVDSAINETGANNMVDLGKVIGMVMNRTGGRADGKKVAEIARNKLS